MKARREGKSKEEVAVLSQLAYDAAAKQWREDTAKHEKELIALQQEVAAQVRLTEIEGE